MYKTIDLFAGIGGIRRGFELTNQFETVLAAEIDKYACETYTHLYGDDPYNDVTTDEFKQKVANTDYDVLLGGFPCQAFSIAGKKEGFIDKTRGTLFFDIADILKHTKPKAFLLENVEGLLRHKKGDTFDTILKVLVKELNYTVVGVRENEIAPGGIEFNPRDFLVNSKDFGLPQNRPRVYIIGFNKDRYHSLTETIFMKELPKKRLEEPIYKDLNDLLEFNAEKEYYLASGYLQTLKNHKSRHKDKGNGYGYIVVNEPGIETPVSNALLATGGSGKERNLVYDPQDGIGGSLVKGKQTPLNDEGIRMMTPREWGKLQGFINYAFMKDGVDHFSFPPKLSKAQQYKQFGNSVTIPVIEVLAREIGQTLDALESKLSINSKEEILS
ncbi:DNA cytosine methyltransferase [Alkalihalobacterium alkalinitrilicum]|uniref:DNA cytosine methyltransferase n=1 Tax=Alkalihalobacterium alkalinitrilicum TaxID=427920 RepID=UPI000994B751|nr:DNA (cytosine-5-)-methyltransferase [Alkalihalobacterium alkalinitrilicum]